MCAKRWLCTGAVCASLQTQVAVTIWQVGWPSCDPADDDAKKCLTSCSGDRMDRMLRKQALVALPSATMFSRSAWDTATTSP